MREPRLGPGVERGVNLDRGYRESVHFSSGVLIGVALTAPFWSSLIAVLLLLLLLLLLLEV